MSKVILTSVEGWNGCGERCLEMGESMRLRWQKWRRMGSHDVLTALLELYQILKASDMSTVNP